MRVDESGNDGLAAEVDLLRPGTSQRLDLVVAAEGKETSIRDRNRQRARVAVVDRDEVAVVEDELRRCPVEEERRRDSKRAEAGQKVTS